MQLHRHAATPPRQGLTWEQRWQGPDDGLIACWEAGQEMRHARPDEALRAEAGQLLPLPWTGGLYKPLADNTKKRGTLYYLAMWQGLRGDDLDIDSSASITLACTLHGSSVLFEDSIPDDNEDDTP